MDEEPGEKVRIIGAEIAIVERDIKALKGHIADLEARLARLLAEHWQLILTAKPAEKPQTKEPTQHQPPTLAERRARVVASWDKVVEDNPRISEKRIIAQVAKQTGEDSKTVVELAFGEGQRRPAAQAARA